MSEQKNKWGGAIGMILGMLLYFGMQEVISTLKGGASFDKTMMEAASELNKNCPFMVDRDTRLDNTIALPDNEFQYNYTLIYLEKDSINFDDVKPEMKDDLIKYVKETPELKMFKDKNTTMNYSYKDKNGEFVGKIVIAATDYK